MASPSLLGHQVKYDLTVFRREPEAVGFTILFPLVFLFVFVGVFGNADITLEDGSTISGATYFLPAILTLAIGSATFVNLSIGVVEDREAGRLKRLIGTPMPKGVFIGSRIVIGILISYVMTALMVAIGAIVFGVDVRWASLPAVLLTVLVVAGSFCAIGVAFTALVPTSGAASPMANLVILPLYFISGVFFVFDDLPEGLQNFARVFPVYHAFEALSESLNPLTETQGFDWAQLGVVALWGIACWLLALRFFRWLPRGG
jgi:ABC-2 type transport system permease protein